MGLYDRAIIHHIKQGGITNMGSIQKMMFWNLNYKFPFLELNKSGFCRAIIIEY